jgi:hypothetical protein
MNFNAVKRIYNACDDLQGLKESESALLLWRGKEVTLLQGANIYVEGTPLDDSFCLLLSGVLAVEKAGVSVGEISGHHIFGEMAYFTRHQLRTATVRVASDEAVFLKFQLTVDEFQASKFSALNKYLGIQAWERFVSASMSLP